MITAQNTDRFAVLPRWLNALAEAARSKARTEAIINLPSLRCGGKNPYVPSFARLRITLDSQPGVKSKPATALKSP